MQCNAVQLLSLRHHLVWHANSFASLCPALIPYLWCFFLRISFIISLWREEIVATLMLHQPSSSSLIVMEYLSILP